MDIITERLKLKDILPKKAKEYAKKFKMKIDDVQLIRKGLTPSDLKVSEDENAIISYITTSTKDRDDEIVDPKGAMLDDYNKNKVVLWGHDYHSRNLPLGRNQWIKADDKGLIAKTEYYIKDEFANKVYNYRKDGFPLAESIGFIPIKWEDFEDEKSIKENGGAKRKYNKWLLLEYSDVPVPSNPDAIEMAIAKGLIPKEITIKPEAEEEDKADDKEKVVEAVKDDKANKVKEEDEINKIADEEKESKSMLELATKYGDLLAEKKLLEEKLEKEDQEITLMKHEIELRDTAIAELEAELKATIEEKAGAVLNKKNKSNLKNAQNLIQEVLDSADTDDTTEPEPTKESGIQIEKEEKTAIEIPEKIADKEVQIEVDEDRIIEIVDKVFEKNSNKKLKEAKEELDTERKKAQGKVL